jgi:hypothetical protein
VPGVKPGAPLGEWLKEALLNGLSVSDEGYDAMSVVGKSPSIGTEAMASDPLTTRFPTTKSTASETTSPRRRLMKQLSRQVSTISAMSSLEGSVAGDDDRDEDEDKELNGNDHNGHDQNGKEQNGKVGIKATMGAAMGVIRMGRRRRNRRVTTSSATTPMEVLRTVLEYRYTKRSSQAVKLVAASLPELEF